MITDLIDLLIQEGTEIDSREIRYESIADAIAGNKIRAILRNSNIVGFFTWREFTKNGKFYIYIENMCVKKEFRNKNNLLFLRRFFREKYPNAIAYWDSKGSWVYAK